MNTMLIFLLLVIAFGSSSAAEDSCWWTGCQKNDWAVRGCGSYNRTQSDVRDCDNGQEFYCCPTTSQAKPEPVKNKNEEKDCWWTGCQNKDWAVRGCSSYNRTQENIRNCQDGNEFYCCEKEQKPPAKTDEECWWTGCQKNNWAIRGCGSYNRTQANIRNCEDGNEFYCCPSSTAGVDNNNPPTKEKGEEEMECFWSSCQPSNWTLRGCPSDMKEIGSQSCGKFEGDMFECCRKKETIEEPDVDPETGESFTNYVKYLLLKGRNFTLEPDSLPCTSIDTDKQMLLQIKNEGLYICDLCPYFPQRRLVNVFLNNVPIDTKSNLLFPECYGFCFDNDECVAFSYDHIERICYTYNNTVGTYVNENKWTTVLMTQPVGVLENWMYSRHTAITGESLQSSTNEKSFLECLNKCDNNNQCNYVSYSLETSKCEMFSDEETINYIDLNYGYVTAIRVTSLSTSGSVASRFTEEGDDLSISQQKNDQKSNNQKCSSSKNNTHSAFYSKECFTSGAIGCDMTTGCKSCYYPEKLEKFSNLPICPDSEFVLLAEIKNSIITLMEKCLKEPSCVGVGYVWATNLITQLSLDNFASDEYTTKFLLRYPTDQGEDHKIMIKYDFLFNYDIEKLSNKANSFQEVSRKTFKECIRLFESNVKYIRMSFWDGKCKLSSEEVKYKLRNRNSVVTAFKKPLLTSPLINYVRIPGFSIPHDKAQKTFNQCNNNNGNCEVICSQKCSGEYREWCTHFSIQYVSNSNSKCFFYNFLDEVAESKVNLRETDNEQVFTKLSNLNFTLGSLNELNPFQISDIYNCFQTDADAEQTQTTLTRQESGDNGDTSVALRRKRGLFDWIKKAVKKVGNFIADTVKSVVKPIVDTAKGVVNTVKNVVKGDFKEAKKSFMEIPVVKDVKTAVDLGKAVVTGDWETAKKRGADLLQSSTLDMATSLIPGGGKLVGQGLKAVGKTIAKSTTKLKKGTKNSLNKVNGNSKPIKKKTSKKTNKDKEVDKKRNQCSNKKRQKREDFRGKKRKRVGDCDNDDDDKYKCPDPNIKNVLEESIGGCKRRARNAVCEFECDIGYDEPRNNVRCVKEGNNNAHWSPAPQCTQVSCQKTPHVLIPFHTPHVTTFGSIEFGKHLTAYVLLYDKNRRLPIWSIALHQSDQFKSNDYTSLKPSDREGSFRAFPCKELKGQQPKNEDYTNSGWDRGHLTPANVARWSEKAALSTNVYINVAPQDPFTNQNPWKHLEGHVECQTAKRRSLVATGVCSAKITTTKTGLEVPACYWKMICYKDENGKEQVVGFKSDNTHATTVPEKTQRSHQVYTPLHQRDIKALYNSAESPWILSATEINKGRPVQVVNSVWFPVNPFDCEKANELSKEELDAWDEGLTLFRLNKLGINKNTKPKKPRKKPNKPKQPKNPKKPAGGGSSSKKTTSTAGKTRTKRQTKSKIVRGCASDSELRNMMTLLGTDEDYEDDDEGGDGSKDGDGGRGGGGKALVNVQSCNKRIIGYYTSWLEKRIEGRHLRRLTHVIFAFIEMRADGSVEIGSADRKNAVNADEEASKAKDKLVNLMKMAKSFPHLKVMFAVGGWENSQYFSSVASDPGKRITFITSIVKMIKRYGFDGIDIDWEYPVTGGANEGIPQDKQNYVILMKEIRTALDNLASESGRRDKYLLSFAGAAGQWTLDPGFDLPGILKYADFANIMSYDFFGAWSSKWGAYTGPPAPLHFGMPPGFSGKTNVDWSVKYYTCKSSLPHKINMGVPFYGRYWNNVGPPVDGKDGMWRKAERVNGKFDGGYVPYDKIESFLSSGGFEKHFHEKSKTPYAWNPATKTFLGYENEESLEHKVEYAEEKNIGGLMIWAVEQDDDDLTLLDIVSGASLCDQTDPKKINFKCSPIDEKRWWTPEDGDDKAGLCGRSAPLFKGYYPVCDPDDPGYSCCGPAGYCGAGEKYCDCPTCKNYGEYPEKILEQPIKPSVPVTWYFLNDPDGKRGRCGRKIPKINGVYPTCNPDDQNAYCCSNGGYCGSKTDHCKCNGCVNFKKNPKYRYGPKKWWEVADGADKQGKCGPKAPKVDGIYEAECEPNTNFSCCSPNGFCGSGKDYCDCKGCRKFT